MQAPSLRDVVMYAEKRLSGSLGGDASISTHTHLDDGLLEKIAAIDHVKFRAELWYTGEELRARVDKPGFFCLMVELDGEPVAYDFGYRDEEPGVYFSDSSATLVERKGVGTVLAVLEMVYLLEAGYRAVKFTTEEYDQAGRPLRRIWENLGYRTVSVDSGGVTMMMDITPQLVNSRVNDHLLSRG
ncbi:MAG: hypothetical protein ABIJ47_09855 [Candidatus Bathyarchaeota archaeon]